MKLKNRHRKRLIAFALLAFLLMAGVHLYVKSTVQPLVENMPMSLEKSFNEFYEQFLTDSAYQMNHIVFPLEGVPAGIEEGDDISDYRFYPEDWIIHRYMDPDNGFVSSMVDHVDSMIVIEYIVHSSGHYGMQRRFALIGGKWSLIYYAGLNAIELGDSLKPKSQL